MIKKETLIIIAIIALIFGIMFTGFRIIEDGEIKNPGKTVRIVHSITDLLKNISAIGSNSKNVLQWASLPSICPTIRAENVKLTII